MCVCVCVCGGGGGGGGGVIRQQTSLRDLCVTTILFMFGHLVRNVHDIMIFAIWNTPDFARHPTPYRSAIDTMAGFTWRYTISPFLLLYTCIFCRYWFKTSLLPWISICRFNNDLWFQTPGRMRCYQKCNLVRNCRGFVSSDRKVIPSSNCTLVVNSSG